MSKSFKCTDVGTPCDWSSEADTDEDLMEKILEHAKEHHGKTDIPLDKVKAAIKDQ